MPSSPARRVAAISVLLGPALLGAAVVTAAPAAAQVTTSQQALDALGSKRPATPAHPAHVPARRHAAAQPAPHPAGHGPRARPVSAHPPAATIPPAPPPPPVFRAPVINVPLHPPPPPPPVPVVPTAAGQATALPDGTRISFGSGSTDLNPATMQALHGVAAELRTNPASRIDLDAFGSASPDDPSTPRRLAFERGIAARAVLINDGIASTRIYVRVIGAAPATTDGAPPDRVDLLLSPAIPGTPANPSTGATRGAPPAGLPAITAAEPGHPSP